MNQCTDVLSYMRPVDWFCFFLLMALGAWKLWELTQKYGDWAGKWLIKKIERR